MAFDEITRRMRSPEELSAFTDHVLCGVIFRTHTSMMMYEMSTDPDAIWFCDTLRLISGLRRPTVPLHIFLGIRQHQIAPGLFYMYMSDRVKSEPICLP